MYLVCLKTACVVYELRETNDYHKWFTAGDVVLD